MVIKTMRDKIEEIELSNNINNDDIQQYNVKINKEFLNSMKIVIMLGIGEGNCMLEKMNEVRLQIIERR